MKLPLVKAAIATCALLSPFFVSLKKAEPAPAKPNILFCIADDASWEHFQAYGKVDWVSTPGFDRVAREGVLFNNAYTPNAKCSPSRACILTGRNPWQLEAAANHVPYFPEKFTTWVEALAENGYKTGFTGKGWAPGNPGERNGKTRLLTGTAYSQLKTQTPTPAMGPVDYAANLKAFLDENTEGKPFCFWYGSQEPHRAYTFGSGQKAGKKTSDIKRIPAYWPDNDTVRQDLLDYAYEVEYFDSQLVRMLQILEEKKQLDNTIIIVTSDNGMPFPRVKGHIYPYDNHLPLAVMWKNGVNNPGRKIDDLVSFIDFAPTLLEAAGLNIARATMQPVEGKSLLPLLLSSKSGQIDPKRNFVLLGKERTDVGRPKDQGYPVRAIVTADYLYAINYEPTRWPAGNPETGYLDTDGSPTKTFILNEKRRNGASRFWDLCFGLKGKEDLYAIRTDPDAMQNLAGKAKYADIQARLKMQIKTELKRQGDPRVNGNGQIFDTYPYAEEKTRNFYERKMRGEAIKANWTSETDIDPIQKN